MPISFVPYTAVYGPLSLPGVSCQLWLDGVDPLGNGSVPANGATVSKWVDKSGNGYNATGGVSPTYNSSQKAITFNGSSWLTTSYSSVPTNETLFVVFQTTSTALQVNAFMIGPTNTGGRLIMSVNENDGFGLSFKIGSYGVTNGSRLSETQNQIYLGTATVASTTSYVYLNGTQGPISSLTYSGTGTTQIGTAVSGSAIYIGYIYEIIIYNTTLSTPQQQAIEGYLAQKWGLTANLPPGHPGLTQTLYNSRVYQPQISLKSAPYANYYPLSLPGCQLWLDGADPAGTGTPPSNGSTVSTWYDKSGTGNNGTSYGNPTFNTSAFNGKSGISFDGSTQRFVGAITNTGTTVSVFAIVSMNSGGQWGRICSLAVTNNFDGGISSAYIIPLTRNSTNQSIQSGRYQGSGNVNVGPVAITYNTPFQAGSIVDGTTNTLYLNGTSSASGSSTGNFGYTAYGIGAQPSNFQPEYFQGYISEIIIYNAALTTAQRQNIEGYLAWKWGLQGYLIGHPYSSAPPLEYTRGAILPAPTLNAFGRLPAIVATGGTITFSGGYKIHTFTTVGTTNFVVTQALSTGTSVQLLIVGGGGGGGNNCGGGGGAGGAIFVTAQTVNTGTYPIIIGAGGSGGINPGSPIYGAQGSNGVNSTALGYTGIGGGGGGWSTQSPYVGTYGTSGGCGGGGGGGGQTAASLGGSPLQAGGFAGGGQPSTGQPDYGGGGGGGMGSVGSNASYDTAGNGGNGATYTIGGTAYTLAGGGGGGTYKNSGGSGGSGGGGVGFGSPNTSGANATYYGSGGGGGAGGGDAPKGGDGYQGIVIIAYPYP